jgi:signal-transduction protein with cAMP-binding, CBS, and nucleotidyltransferase domain
MTKNIISCDLNISVTELMETMTNKKIRHMTIMEAEELKGIVSIGDVVNHVIKKYKEENDSLRDYINNF